MFAPKGRNAMDSLIGPATRIEGDLRFCGGMRIDGQVRESSIKKVGEVVSAHPEEALAIIRTWLHQPV